MIGTVRVGCGVWRNRDWEGSLYRQGSDPATYLSQYAVALSAVECHSTFYSLPKAETIQKWKGSVSSDFKFCFKAPKTITHIRRLRGTEENLRDFLNLIEPLGDHLGPVMLQFPPSFSPSDSPILTAFLHNLPKEFAYTVEFRHPAFFSSPEYIQKILSDNISLCIVDARIKFVSGPVAEAGSHQNVDFGPSPIIQFIGQEKTDHHRPFLQQWVPCFSGWVNQNKSPYFFAHTDTDRNAPQIAAQFLSFFPGLPQLKLCSSRQLELF